MSEIMAKLDSIERMIVIGSKEVLTIEECSVFTGLSRSTLYSKTSAREIPHYRPRGGKLYFKKSEIEEWLLQNRRKSNKEIKSIAAKYIRQHK